MSLVIEGDAPDRNRCFDCGCDIWDHNAPEVGGCGSCGDCEGWR